MRLVASFLISLAVAGTASAQQAAPAAPVVHVGLFNYGQDGRVMGAAYENDQNALSSTVWTSRTGCQIGAGNRKPPIAATDAWEFSGQVTSASADGATLRLDWRKTVDDGKAVAGIAASQQLTLTKGQPVVLDSITPLAPCSGTAVVFEARYDVDFVRLRIGNLPVRGDGRSGSTGFVTPSRAGSGSGGGVGSGTGAGSGAGGGGGFVAGVGGATGSGSGFGSGSGAGSGGAVRGSASDSAASGSTVRKFYSVELWFIRHVGGQEQVVAHPVLKMGQEGASFAFNPVTVQVGGAPAMAQVTGSLRISKSPTGEDQLTFITMRRLTDGSATMPRDGAQNTVGSSITTHPMPGPEDVLSFEMPPLEAANGQTVADRFSVRLRIAHQ